MIKSIKVHAAHEFNNCGSKAYHLARLSNAGFNVPAFICLELIDLETPQKIWQALKETGIVEPYAVRSSAIAEDGELKSYAGQFNTFLHVDASTLLQRVADCFAVKSNLKYHPTDETEQVHCVIIQQMLDPDTSGIMFTRNPMGILNERVLVVGHGVGSNVVEDKTEVTTYYYNIDDDLGYQESQAGAPHLSDSIQAELLQACLHLENEFFKGVDVEFAILGETLYYLQARKITTLSYRQPIILDNSNIVESYPGITLPLTADFVSKQYAAIFKGVVARISGNKNVSKKYEATFDHMVEYYNGRMYYQIINWYGVINFLPFSKKIVPVWRKMLGVSHDDILPSPFKISSPQRFSIALHTFYYLLMAPRKMQELDAEMQKAQASFDELLQRERTLEELKYFYDTTVSQIMNKWDYTLINDMYTFIYTGLSTFLMKKRGLKEDALQKEISDVTYLASLQPVKELLNCALEYKTNGKSSKFITDFDIYINKYGDRTIGELKMETNTYREKPELLMQQIEQYASLPNLVDLIHDIENTREKETIKGLAGLMLKRAKQGIEGREKSRMDRTRLFGFARSLFLQAGNLLKQAGHIENQRDVFYLTMDEIFATETPDYKDIITLRKKCTESYESSPAFSRIVFDTKIIQKPFIGVMNTTSNSTNKLQGIPCSDGIVKGEVYLVEDLNNLDQIPGKILVTHSTDPGWAFLLASATGLISEKGSILSHTAIIARELHTPMIVAVKDVMKQLKNGDIVEMDCNTGLITKCS